MKLSFLKPSIDDEKDIKLTVYNTNHYLRRALVDHVE